MLKKLSLTLCTVIILFLTLQAQAPLKLYETLPDAEEKKLLKGILQKSDITADTSFTWYAQNLKYFKPNVDAVAAVRQKADQVQVVLFAGTWCHDSQQIVPKYFATLEAAGFPDDRLTIFGMDRPKTTIAGLQKVFNVTMVPTLLLMKEGKEVGRIVEFGSTALMDQELGNLFKLVQ